MTPDPDPVLRDAVRAHLVAEVDRQRAPVREARTARRGARVRPVVVFVAVAAVTVALSGTALVAGEALRGRTSAPAAPVESSLPVLENAATCRALLDDATRAALRAEGFALAGEQYLQKVADDPSAASREFLSRGGVACRWGTGSSDTATVYAYGPITAEDAAALQRRLVADGASRVPGSPFARYAVQDGATVGDAFGDGHWAYVLDTADPDDPATPRPARRDRGERPRVLTRRRREPRHATRAALSG